MKLIKIRLILHFWGVQRSFGAVWSLAFTEFTAKSIRSVNNDHAKRITSSTRPINDRWSRAFKRRQSVRHYSEALQKRTF